MNRWQPIETAPLNGTEILLLAHGMVIQARFCPARFDEGAVWCAFDDAVQFEIEEYSDGNLHGPVTHWQPLPELPEKSQ